MTDDIQHETYADANRIKSDPFGILSRDNRNHRKKLQRVLAHVHADPGDRVLEVGCGHGIHARRYAERFDYTGIDISDSLVAETDARTPTDATVRCGDAMDILAPDNSFQAVVGNAVLHHMADFETALREWCRVVTPGGSVTLTEPNYLFPKDFIETHVLAEERHKRNMAPWRLRRLLDSLPYDYTVQPFLYTLPWPESLHGVYDGVDNLLSRVPGVRWTAQMLLIHIQVNRP